MQACHLADRPGRWTGGRAGFTMQDWMDSVRWAAEGISGLGRIRRTNSAAGARNRMPVWIRRNSKAGRSL